MSASFESRRSPFRQRHEDGCRRRAGRSERQGANGGERDREALERTIETGEMPLSLTHAWLVAKRRDERQRAEGRFFSRSIATVTR